MTLGSKRTLQRSSKKPPAAAGRRHPRHGRNHLMQAMTIADLEASHEVFEWQHLVRGRTLYEPGDAAKWLYFPESALLSISARLRAGSWVETNVVGHEGVVGLIEASARGVMASHVRVHSAGDVWRTSADDYRSLAVESEAMRLAAHHHFEAVMAELRQSVVCHTHHGLDQRLCRWILERHDQLGGDSLAVTRACLADVLGVQRTSVSESASRLRKRGLIRLPRASIVIVDRAGLEAGACECRGTIAVARRSRQAAGPHLDPTKSSHPATLPSVV